MIGETCDKSSVFSIRGWKVKLQNCIPDRGDVAIELEDGGFEKVAEADAGSWFQGALPL